MRVILLFVAFALSAAAAFFTYQLIADEPEPVVAEPRTVYREAKGRLVFVAEREIPVGTQITAENFDELVDRKEWPESMVLEEFFVAPEGSGAGGANIIGMVARSHYQPGEPLMKSKMANPDDPGFLAATLPAGMRAVTIATDPVAGLSGFVYPGDRVDVLFTYKLTLPKDSESKSDLGGEDEPSLTETLVSNVRVLAVNQMATMGESTKAKERDRRPTTITLEVPQAEAQRLRLAEREGQLSLALRSLKDLEDQTKIRPVAEQDLSRLFPPAYFPALYDFDKDYIPQEAVEGEAAPAGVPAMGGAGKQKKERILIVRGVKVEEMEVNKP